MEASFKREELLHPLMIASSVVERRQTLPILSNIRISAEADGKVANLTATDLEVEVVISTTAQKINGEPTTVSARKLLDICRALPDGAELEMKTSGERLTVKAGRSRFTLATLPAGDFPVIETKDWLETVTVPQATFRQLLEATQFCMAQQDVRYYLNGLLIELQGKVLRAVATDGHRMAVGTLELAKAVSVDRQVIVPRKAILELSRSLVADSEDEARIAFGNNQIQVRAGKTSFTAKLVDGRFPDYTKVIPAKQARHLALPCAELREALGRVAILSNEKYRGVRLNLSEGALRMSAHNPEQEEAQEELPVDYHGDSLDIGFNVNYLIDAINALQGKTAEVGLSDANSSCTINAAESDNPRYIIMPMRL